MENVTKEEAVTCEGEKSEMDFQISCPLTCKFTPNRMEQTLEMVKNKTQQNETIDKTLLKSAN